MLRKVWYGLLFTSLLVTGNVFAMNNMVMGLSMTFEFIPNVPRELTNITFSSLTATCEIETPDSSNELIAEMVNKTATINGQLLSKGDSYTLTVHKGGNLIITADSGAQVKLTNLGTHTFLAICTSSKA